MDNQDYKDIDRLFSNHFQGKQVPVADKEQLWQDIRSGKKRRTGIFWSLAGILFVLTSAFAWMQLQSNGPALDMELANATTHQALSEKKTDQSIEESEDVAAFSTMETENSRTGKAGQENIGEDFIPAQTENFHSSGNQSSAGAIPEEANPASLERKKEIVHLTESRSIRSEGFENLSAKNDNNLLPLALSEKQKVIDLEPAAAPDWDKCWVRPRGQWFLDAYTQFGAPIEDINNTGESSSYAAEWEEQFDPAYSYHGGLMAGYQFHWNGYLAAGLEYQQFQTEHLNELRIIETIQIYDPRAYYTVDENGERQYFGDTVTVTNIRDEIKRSANNYKMLHLPIHLGYRSNGKYWRYGIDFSALVNLSFRYEGVFLRADGAVVEIDDNNRSDYFADGIGTSFSAALHLGRMVGDRTEIYLQPRFRFNNQNYLNDDAGLSIERNFAGLRFGLRYYLE